MNLKFTGEFCVTTVKNDAQFEEELTFNSIYLFYFILLLFCKLSTNKCSHDHTNSL